MGRRKTKTIFNNLFGYFITIVSVCVLIPVLFYTLFFISNFASLIEERSRTALRSEVIRMEDLFASYMNKAIVVGSDRTVIELLKEKNLSAEKLKVVYSLLFSEFGTNESIGEASLVSTDGNIRLSTRTFPESYDLRIHMNDWDQNTLMQRATDPNSPDLFTMMGERRVTSDARIVFASIVKKVRDYSDNLLGYLIIDLYSEPFIDPTSPTVFQEEILIDRHNLTGFSFLHPSLFGHLNQFPSYSESSFKIIEMPVKGTSFTLRSVSDISYYKHLVFNTIVILVIVIVIGIISSVLISLIFSHRLTKRFRSITNSIKNVEEGNLSLKMNEDTGIKEFNELSHSLNVMAEELNSLIELTREEEIKLAEAERKELETQLNPHFLFNTLNTIKSLAALNGEKEIYTIAIKLGKLLRESLKHDKPIATVEETIEFLQSYLTIQKIRFGERLEYSIEADESLYSFTTPKLIIQPLVENAVVHGIEPQVKNGKVEVLIKDEGKNVSFTVRDNGAGFDSSEYEEKLKFGNSDHIGLYNIYRRLKLHYGEKATFNIKSEIGIGTEVRITIDKE